MAVKYDVRVSLPPEHEEAVREDLLEELALRCDRLFAEAAQVHSLVETFRGCWGGPPESRDARHLTGHRLRLRDWAKDAREDARETLDNLDTYYEPEWWEKRSRSLLAASEHVLDELARSREQT